MSHRRAKLVVGISVIVVCLVYLVAAGLQKTAMYYLTVNELEAREAEFVDERIRLSGRVVPGSISRRAGRSVVTFAISEPGGQDAAVRELKRTVRYAGLVPDTFKDEADVVLEGRTGADGIFRAETLLAKCPSKYEGKSFSEMKSAHSD